MAALMQHDFYGFALGFLIAFQINIEVGIYSLFGGLCFGLPLIWLNAQTGIVGYLSKIFISFLRAFPTYVLIFVLLNLFGIANHLFNINIEHYKFIALVGSLCAYSSAAIFTVTNDCWQHFMRNERAEALLIIPNIFRIFTILVMSSSIGAAIGINEAVFYTINFTESIQEPSVKILFVLISTVFFVAFFSVMRLILSMVIKRLGHINQRNHST